MSAVTGSLVQYKMSRSLTDSLLGKNEMSIDDVFVAKVVQKWDGILPCARFCLGLVEYEGFMLS